MSYPLLISQMVYWTWLKRFLQRRVAGGCMLRWFLFLIMMLLLPAAVVLAENITDESKNDDVKQNSSPKYWSEQNWGIGVSVRIARIPFDTEERTVPNLIPELYFENDRFYIRGLESGLNLLRLKKWELYALGRMRFFDIPSQYQNRVQEDSFDLGFQLRMLPTEETFVEAEVLSDFDYRLHSNLRLGFDFIYQKFEWMPYFNARYKTTDFNNHYYGLTLDNIGSDIDLSAGVEAEYHLYRNLYLVGSFQLTRLGQRTQDSEFINKAYLDETYLGIKIANEHKEKSTRKKYLRNTPYVRVAHGWGTESSLSEIIRFNTKPDPYNHQLSSIFYGHPLTDEIFGFPLDIYLTPGFLWHYETEVQDSAQEYVVGIKAYYTFKWPITWRFGAAEGMSYITDVTYIEKTSMEKKDYDISKLMNYLDFSLDVNLTDLFKLKGSGAWWLGYSIHHRSSIFESASHFGRIGGGSNYNTIYVQYHF
jgi:outer membrane protein